MSKEISVSDLKSVCPFCGGSWVYNAYFSPDGLVVSCKSCGAIVDAHIADARPIEDALNKRIEELESERDEARAIVEQLIVAENGIALSTGKHPDEAYNARYLWNAIVSKYRKERAE
jgi:hypothetical protein